MANVALVGRIKLAWWLKPYFYGLATMAALTGLDPDWSKVNRMINRAVTVKFETAKEGIGGA